MLEKLGKYHVEFSYTNEETGDNLLNHVNSQIQSVEDDKLKAFYSIVSNQIVEHFNGESNNEEYVLNKCKRSLEHNVEKLKELGVNNNAYIEIELVHYIKKLLYTENH